MQHEENKETWTKIGEGGYGAVWINNARDAIIKREKGVAEDGISPSVLTELSVYNQFQFEKKSRCLPKLIDFAFLKRGDMLLSKMKLEAGKYSLKDLVYEDIDPKTFAKLFYKAAKCLGFLNIQGILHSDVKPSNLIIGNDDSVRIIDFGISQIDRSAKQVYPKDYPVYTLTYRPPEVLLEMHYGFEADVFALGMTFLELYLGTPYIDEDSAEEQLENQFRYLGVRIGGEDYPYRMLHIKEEMKKACLDTRIPYNLYMQEEWHNKPNRPKIKDPLLLDLLTGMINPSIPQRYRYEKILDHPYFKQFNLNPPKLIERYYNFLLLKREITARKRKNFLILAEWLLDVGKSWEIQLQTVLLSFHLVMLLDFSDISKIQLQGSVCLRLASQLYKTDDISINDLIHFSADSFSREEFLEMQLEVFTQLNYNIFITTPLDYYQQTHPVWNEEDIYNLIGLYFSDIQDVFTMNPRESAKIKPKIPDKYHEYIRRSAKKFTDRFNVLPIIKD